MMKMVVVVIAVAALVAVAAVPGESEVVSASSGGLQSRLNTVIANAKLGSRAAVGACVVDLTSGRIVLSHNGESALIPASNQKILTSAAALATLGADHKLVTTLSASGIMRGSVLDGDLLLVGCGDPNLSGRFHGGDVTRPLRQIGYGLAKAGITRVTGSLIYDGRAFSGPRIHPEWPEDQILKWYSAEVSALALNDNCLTITVTPTSPGKAASVSYAPTTGYVSATGSVATTGKKADPKVGFGRVAKGNELKLWGELSAYRGEYVGEVTVSDPDAYFAHVMMETLAANGITISGGIRAADATVDGRTWREVGRHESDLGTVVAVCNQNSQNLYAENLLRMLGRARGGDGSFLGGAKAVKAWLDERRIAAPGLVVSDGSGLARSNRVSAETLARTLAVMARHKEGGVYASSMAVSGESGTLAKRFDDAGMRGRVVAKTGTIRAVSTLSGYVVSKSGKRYAFSVLVNNFSGSAKAMIDSFVEELVAGG